MMFRAHSHADSSARSAHLIVLIHGLYGNPGNLAVVKEELERAASASASTSAIGDGPDEEEDEDEVERQLLLPPNRKGKGKSRAGPEMKTRILVLSSFQGSHTWDGIDVNAHRAAREVDSEIKRLKEEEDEDVKVFSIMGYSLGGLVARYLVGLLHSRSPSFFDRHRPGSFTTFATPHVGVLRYGSRVNTLVHTVGRHLFSRSGQQLYRLDRDEHGHCLLSTLADPGHIFVEALRLFPRIRIVANGCNDLTVPYPTGSISLHDPFVDHEHHPLHVELDDEGCIVSHAPRQERDPSITVAQQRRRQEVHRFPPIFYLPLRWPFNLLGFVLVPLLIPVFLLYALITFWLHSRQSSSRTASALKADETTPLLSSRPVSRARTPPQAEKEEKPNRIPLLLDPEQRLMIHHLNKSLPQMERTITWWPWCFNTHAMLIVRAAKRFAYQEEGRGVVRKWAEWAVDVDVDIHPPTEESRRAGNNVMS